MAMYNEGNLELTNGGTTWASSTIVCILVSSGYVFDADHTYISDLTNELTNPGYARQTVGSKTGPTKNNAANRVEYACGDVTFPSLGAGSTPAAAVLARSTGIDGTSPLLAYVPLSGTPPAPNGGNYTIDFVALTGGVMQLNS